MGGGAAVLTVIGDNGKQRPFPHRRLRCPLGSTSTTTASDSLLARDSLPGVAVGHLSLWVRLHPRQHAPRARGRSRVRLVPAVAGADHRQRIPVGLPDPRRPTVGGAYDAAMAKVRSRQQLPLIVADRPVVPDRMQWLHTEMLKTRVAHGYCSRHLTADACPYANICEQCDNFTTSTESSRSSKPNSPTRSRYARTPTPAAGTARSPGTPASSPTSSAISLDSATRRPQPPGLDPGPRAG